MSKPAAPAELIAKIRSTHQQILSQTYYDRLGVDTESDVKAIRRAYNQAAALWHPDRHNKWDLGEDEQTLTNLFAMLTEAQTVLTSKPKRADYDAELELSGGVPGKHGKRVDAAALFQADSTFRLGQQLLERGKISAARDRFGECFELNPDAAEFRVHLAYTEFLLLPRDDKGKPRSNSSVERAQEEIEGAIKTLPEFADGHVMMGRLHMDMGRIAEAKRSYQEALYIDRKNVQAQRQLRLLNMRKDSSGAGGLMDKLKSLFKKG
jgi:curved DNA-binding protein CbpA